MSGPFASLISSLINIISLLLTTFDWTKVRGIAPRSHTGRPRTCLVLDLDFHLLLLSFRLALFFLFACAVGCYGYGIDFPWLMLVAFPPLGRLPFSFLRLLFLTSAPILAPGAAPCCFAVLILWPSSSPFSTTIADISLFLLVVGGWLPSIALLALPPMGPRFSSLVLPFLVSVLSVLLCFGGFCGHSPWLLFSWFSFLLGVFAVYSLAFSVQALGLFPLFLHPPVLPQCVLLFISLLVLPLPLLAELFGSFSLSLSLSGVLHWAYSLVVYWVSYCLFLLRFLHRPAGFISLAPLPSSVSSLSLLGSWCSSLSWYPSSGVWAIRLGFSLAAGFSRFMGCFSFRSVISWPSCSPRCRCASFCFCFSPLRVFVGPSSLLHRWLSSLGASLPSVLCLAAVVCASCRIHIPLFTPAFFFLSWPCRFLFFASAVSFCCAIPLFFLC